VTDYNSINQRLSQLIADNTKIKLEDIHPELNLEGSGLDSFARIELILIIEEQFRIELSDSESADVVTIDDLIKIIQAKTSNG